MKDTKITKKRFEELTNKEIARIREIERVSDKISIYETYDWINTISFKSEDKIYYYLALSETVIVGFLPIIINSKFLFFKTSKSPYLETRYSSPVTFKDDSEVAKQLLSAFDNEPRSIIKSLTTNPKTNLESQLKNLNYNLIGKRGGIVDISKGELKTFNNFSKTLRATIRKAKKDKIEVFEGSKKDIGQYYEMAKETFLRTKSHPPPLELYHRLHQNFTDLIFLMARHKENSIAGVIILPYKKTMYYFSGFGFDRYRHFQPLSLLLWQSIKRGIEYQYHSFDMLGYDLVNLEKFKKKWGCTTSHHYIAKKKSKFFFNKFTSIKN